MSLKKRANLLDWARANDICQTVAYQMAHAKKYRGIILKIEGRWKVDVNAMEELLQGERRYA